MPFPTFPADLEKTALAAVENSTKVAIDLSDDLSKLKKAFDKINVAAFQVPKRVANDNELTGFRNSLDGEMTRIKTFGKSLTDFNKEAFAKCNQLEKGRANPAAIKHVKKIVCAGTAFVKTMADLSRDLSAEAPELVKKARLLLEGNDKTEEAPDEFLLAGLKFCKSKPGIFAFAIGKENHLILGQRIAPALLSEAKKKTGGKFIRGECFFEENIYVFKLQIKPPGGLARKIKKAILDQSGGSLKPKVVVRGPEGADISDENDTDNLATDIPLEDVADTPAEQAMKGDPLALITARAKSVLGSLR